MQTLLPAVAADGERTEPNLINISRRGFVGSLVLAMALPAAPGRAQSNASASTSAPPKPGTRVQAFLEIRSDGSILFRSPFVEGGQGIATAMAQIVGEELDVDPHRFIVECAPPGPDYLILNGRRLTGGSYSTRTAYEPMRRLGASARQMLVLAASNRWKVPVNELTTQSGEVRHAVTRRRIAYALLSSDAATLPVPEEIHMRDPKNFRWIGKPVARLDVRDKSTGRAQYAIDLAVEGMLQAAVQHAPRLGMEPLDIENESEVRAMAGVHSIHRLPGAVAVLANRWWSARRAVQALKVQWREAPPGTRHAMPADFSSERLREQFAAASGDRIIAESEGNVEAAFDHAGARTVEAVYDAPFLAHGQLEPPSAIARFNSDGGLELWMPNQAPEQFQRAAAEIAGLPAENVKVHSPMLGGFFGRHFLYNTANPFPQAILLAKASGRPVKLIWNREEDFLRDALRPLGVARFKASLNSDGIPTALQADAIGEGPTGRWYGTRPGVPDASAVEGIAKKHYAIPNRVVAQIPASNPAMVGYWRSVGHSMNDFFYEAFLDEIAEAGKQDPYALRLRLLADKPRQRALLEAVADLSGGWKRGPFKGPEKDTRARGVAMASPFGSEVATIAEVSIREGSVAVHDVWVAIDPGRIVNPAIIEAQVNSAVALGLSATLLEQVVYQDGMPVARNFDGYPILPPSRMARVHVRIVESGAPMGGIGEPGLPGVLPAVVNAVATLTGQRVRSLPLSKFSFEGA